MWLAKGKHKGVEEREGGGGGGGGWCRCEGQGVTSKPSGVERAPPHRGSADIIDTSIVIFKTVAKFFLNSLADLRLEGQIGWPVALPIRGYHVGTPDWNCHWPANLTTHRPEIFP